MFSMNVHLGLGLVAAIGGSVAFVAYIRDTIWGQTRPCRSTWLIWSALSALSLASVLNEGATTSAIFLGSQCGFTFLIFILSLVFGGGGLLTRRDAIMLGVAGIGLLIWWWTDSALWALGLSITVSAVGGIGTLMKSWQTPHSENLTCWGVSFLAAVAGIGSVSTLTPALLAYPVYLAVLYGAILTALWVSRKKRAGKPAPLLLGEDMRVVGRLPYRRNLRRF